MGRRLPRLPHRSAWSLLLLLTAALPARAQQGLVLAGVGPINRSMGGAAVAAPLDASGALHWNPASISGLPSSEMEFGFELLYPFTTLSSAVHAGALGPGVPATTLVGSDHSDGGAFPLPTVGLVYRPEQCDWTYGLGLFAVGGFAVNYPASTVNPILTAQPPNGIGFGSLSTQFEVLQLDPTLSYQLTKNLSIGFAPTLNLAGLFLDPGVLAAPDDANGNGFPTYPAATHSRITWGLGAQAGVYYTTDAGLNFGASLKSPQWFESFRYNAVDELGRPRSLKFRFDYPMIASIGAAYTGLECVVIDLDLRYIDYHDTKGFTANGLDAAGALRGLGWDSTVVVALGVQYQPLDCLTIRAGYTYNMNPIPDDQTMFNVASPTITEHMVALGATYHVTDKFSFSAAYGHGFAHEIHGPYVGAARPIAGTAIDSKVSLDFVTLGARVMF
jgi:long-chain fatty acid transport protein